MPATIYTPWGYSVESLPALMTVAEFHAATGNKYIDSPQEQIEAAIDAASAAVRDLCGWHVAPALTCAATLTAGDELTGERSRIIALPAAYVSGIISITEDGAELDAGEFAAMQNGLIRRACFKAWTNTWGGVVCEYVAGFDAAAVPSLINAVTNVIEAALSVPYGIASETAGGISVSYSTQAAATAAQAAYLMRPALNRYKVVSSYAT